MAKNEIVVVRASSLHKALAKIRNRSSTGSSFASSSITTTDYEFKDSGREVLKKRKKRHREEEPCRKIPRLIEPSVNEYARSPINIAPHTKVVTALEENDVVLVKDSNQSRVIVPPTMPLVPEMIRMIRLRAKDATSSKITVQESCKRTIQYCTKVFELRFLRPLPDNSYKVLHHHEATSLLIRIVNDPNEPAPRFTDSSSTSPNKMPLRATRSCSPEVCTLVSESKSKPPGVYYPCRYCGKDIRSQGLKAHEQACERLLSTDSEHSSPEVCTFVSESKSKPPGVYYPCRYCGKEIRSQGLKAHEQACGPVEGQQTCKFCGKNFAFSGVKIHEKACRRKHGKQSIPRTHPCKHCGKLFTPRGAPNHEKMCGREQTIQAGDLVWAIQGKTEHMATATGKERSHEGKTELEIKWSTNDVMVYVSKESVRPIGNDRSQRRARMQSM